MPTGWNFEEIPSILTYVYYTNPIQRLENYIHIYIYIDVIAFLSRHLRIILAQKI